MNISKKISNDTITISVDGKLDTLTAPQFEQEVNDAHVSEYKTFELDMEKVEYVSSSGLRVILSLHKKATQNNSVFKITNVNSMVMELFNMTGMADYLNIE